MVYNKSNHLYGLDIIRGLSAILIVLFHYTCRYNENPITEGFKTDWPFSVYWGCAAVSTFFILSGFLTTKHLYNENFEPVDYLRNRIKRLYPAFVCAIFTTSLVCYFLLSDVLCCIRDFLLNFTMIPMLFKAKCVDGAYWTLQIELFFYCILAGICSIHKLKTRIILIFSWLLLSIVMSIFSITFGQTGFNTLANNLLITNHSQEFIAGLSLGIIVKGNNKGIGEGLFFLSIINQFLCQNIENTIFFIVTCLFIFFVLRIDCNPIFKKKIFKPIIWYARISYPLYLIHQMIGFGIIVQLIKYGFTNFIFIIVPIAAVTFIAYYIHIKIEKK